MLSRSAVAQRMSLTSANRNVDAPDMTNIAGLSSNLLDHHGGIMPTSTGYSIYWGDQSAFPSDLKSGMQMFFEGYGSSLYSDILIQYLRGASPAVFSFRASTDDTNLPPTSGPSVSGIVKEVCKSIANHSLPYDRGGIYFVFTSNFTSQNNYCAWHSYGSCRGKPVKVVYLPNADGVWACSVSNPYSLSGSTGLRSMVNIAAHELSETITDPKINAWRDPAGAEVGDKCAWDFAGPVTLGNGSTWQMQMEWSNAVSGCVQTQ
jgi:hypothetical protein